MDINKGLVLDGLDLNKPNGSWAVAKNILVAEGWKSVKNEYGFDNLLTLDTYVKSKFGSTTSFTVLNSVTDGDAVYIFGTINYTDAKAHSTILKLNVETEEVELIYTSCTSSFKLYFDQTLPIDIIYTYLPNGDFVLAWCNGIEETSLPPMILNVTTRNETVLTDNILVNESLIYLFPRTDHIISNTSILQNGNLLPGVYYITARFIFIDDSVSEWCMLSEPIKIGSNPDETTDYSIKIEIDTVKDIPRKGIEVAYIRKHKGIVKAYRYEKLNGIDSDDIASINRTNIGKGISFTGISVGSGSRTRRTDVSRNRTAKGITVDKDSENVYTYNYNYEFEISETKGYEIDLDSILIKRAFYEKAESITNANNKLYLASIKEQKIDFNYEELAKCAYVEYIETAYLKGDINNKTFAPGEVYSIYIYFVLKDSGLLSMPYNIPGRDAISGRDDDFTNLHEDTSGALSGDIYPTFDFSTDLIKKDYAKNGIRNISVTATPGEPVNYGINSYIMFSEDFDIEDASFDDDFLQFIEDFYTNCTATITADGSGKNIHLVQTSGTPGNGPGLYIDIYDLDALETVTSKFTRINELNKKGGALFLGGYSATYLTKLMGHWKNEASVGGDQHHRFPTLRTLRNGSDSAFGSTKFTRLGIKISNIIIPESIRSKIDYIGIAVAKRTSEDKMYYGESLAFPYFKKDGTSNQYCTFSPELHKHRYTDFETPTPSTPSYDTHGFALYNFDILENDLRVNINQFVPAYTVNYGSTKILELIGASNISSYMGYLFNTNEATTAILAEEVVDVDFNAIVPHNAIINYDYDYVATFGANVNQANYNRIARDNNVGSIYNKAGSKHIYCLTTDGRDFSHAYATTPTPSGNVNRVFPDSAGTDGESTAGSRNITHTEFKLDFGSIYSYKRNVYVEPNSKDLFVLNKLIKVDTSYSYSVEIDNDGDCIVSEHLLNLTSDAFIDEDTGAGSDNEKRALSENYARNSNLCITNRSIYNYLGTSISDVNRVYENTSIQSKRYFDVLGDMLKTVQYNAYEKPEYGYEKDYNSLQDLDVPVYAEKELLEYNKSKIIFSKLLNNENLSINSLKTFLIDNYYILPSDKDGIINVIADDNSLYIQCRKGLFFARIKDYIGTDGKNTYLGTGDIFDRMPDEIKFAKNRSIYCSHKMSSLLFDFGYAVFDDYNKMLVTFNGKELDILSNKNASQFFNKYFNFSGLTYNPLEYNNNGVILTYDRFNKNLHIINKNSNNTYNFNLSFNYSIGNFLAFHDWIGDNFVQYRDNLLSFKHTSTRYSQNITPYVYKHNNKLKRAIFYSETPFESYIDIIINGGTLDSKLFEVIKWKSDFIDLDNGVSRFDKTFTKIMIYTKDQCSDIITLDNPAHGSDWFNMIQRNINDEWLFNNFSDGVISNVLPILNNIFRELNVSNVNTSAKDWFNNSVFESEYIVIRLIYNNEIDGLTGTNQSEIIFNSLDVEGKILKR